MLSFPDAVKLDDAGTAAVEIVDVSAEMYEIESEAWDWADSLAAFVTGSDPRSGVYDGALTRGVALEVFMPLATARRLAQMVRRIVPDVRDLDAAGINDALQVELETAGFRVRRIDQSEPNEADGPGIRVGLVSRCAVRLGRLLAIVLRSTLLDLHCVLRLIAQTARGPFLQRTEMVLLVLPSAEVHLRLLESTFAEARRRGWRLVVCPLSPSTRLGEAVGADERLKRSPVEFIPRLSLSQLVARRLGRDRLSRTVHAWAADSGLSMHAAAIARGFETHVWHVKGMVNAHRCCLWAVQPSAVLAVSEILPSVEAMVPAARSRGIPVVLVQHGAINGWPVFRRFDYDAFCVFGEAYAEMLAEGGTRSDRIHVVGNPFMDLNSGTESVVAPQPQSMGRHTGKRLGPRILFAAGYASFSVSDWILFRTLDMVLEYADHNPASEVVVKLHPIGEGHEYGYEVAMARHSDSRVRMVREDDLYALIRGSDCVATHGSTVAIEAASMGVPTILLSLEQARDSLPLVAEGVALRATDSVAFETCAQEIVAEHPIASEAFRAFDMRYAFLHDGKAGSRILDECERLVGL